MENLVTRSKYVPETISILVDFSDVLPAGQTIQGTPLISIALETGNDPTPASILYLGVSVHNGTVVEQRFRLGVPGVIYELVWQVVSNSGEVFAKTTYLAIVPNAGNASPDHQYIFLTSFLYPLQDQEYFAVSFQANNGSWIVGQTFMQDVAQVLFTVNNGDFYLGQLFYTTLPDQFNVAFTVNNGTFLVGQLFYTTPPDQFKVAFAVGNGTFLEGQVFYTTPADAFQIFFTPLNGEFTHA